MRFELYVAARYLKAKRRQAVVGVVTAISVAGITAGVAALIIALAITNGMQRDLQDRLVDSSAHVQLLRTKNDGIRDWQPLLARLRKLPHVVAAAPELDEQVMVGRGARAGYALIEGIVPGYEQAVSKTLSKAPSAALRALDPAPAPASPSNAEYPPVILGNDLAESLGATVGDSIIMVSPQGDLTPLGMVPKVVHFQLAGVYHTGFFQYDSAWGFIRLADAQLNYDEPYNTT
jgi:lipoprotein-releasing system permease protein